MSVCVFLDCNEDISEIFANKVIYTYNTYLYLHYLGTNTLEETIYTLFLYASIELYSLLYTLECTYTLLMYTVGGSFRPVCGTPMSVSVHPIFNGV